MLGIHILHINYQKEYEVATLWTMHGNSLLR
jgi:hypothetical protein